MSDTAGVLYFNHGRPHLARLLVSLYSLRAHYKGPVTILDTRESGGVIEKIAGDDRLAVEVQSIDFVPRRRNSCYCMKPSLWRNSPYKTTLFLDSDTIVAGDVRPLLYLAGDKSEPGFVVTQFSDWVTTGQTIRGRIERWRGVKALSNLVRFEKTIDADDLINASLAEPYPAINTGVIAWRSDRATERILRDWERLTDAGWKCPFTDEYAAQLLLRMHKHVIIPDRWNCSPIYGKEKRGAVIWHAHGSKHVHRPDGRGLEGHAIWWPIFCRALEANIGRVRDWAPADDGNLARHLNLVQGLSQT